MFGHGVAGRRSVTNRDEKVASDWLVWILSDEFDWIGLARYPLLFVGHGT